jgi:hypothetical protein
MSAMGRKRKLIANVRNGWKADIAATLPVVWSQPP